MNQWRQYVESENKSGGQAAAAYQTNKPLAWQREKRRDLCVIWQWR
jgi:hypothetical protein